MLSLQDKFRISRSHRTIAARKYDPDRLLFPSGRLVVEVKTIHVSGEKVSLDWPSCSLSTRNRNLLIDKQPQQVHDAVSFEREASPLPHEKSQTMNL